MIFTNCCVAHAAYDPTFTARGSPLVIPAALIGVLIAYIAISLSSGGVWLIPTLRILGRRENPAVYWAVIVAAALALTLLLAGAAYASAQSALR